MTGVEERGAGQLAATSGIEPHQRRVRRFPEKSGISPLIYQGSIIQPATIAASPSPHAGAFAFHSQRCASYRGRLPPAVFGQETSAATPRRSGPPPWQRCYVEKQITRLTKDPLGPKQAGSDLQATDE